MQIIVSASSAAKLTVHKFRGSPDVSKKAQHSGLEYYGRGRFGKGGKVTHTVDGRSLVPASKKASVTKHYRVFNDDKLGDNVPVTADSIAAHKNKIVNDVASAGHGAWQKDYKKANGKDAKRIKKTKDASWIKKNGTDEVDIANTSYEDLPSDWKKENLESAKSAVRGLHASLKKSGADQADASHAEDAADRVHKDWLKRNGAWAPEEQKKDYKDLSTEEKNKDRFFVDQALRSHTKHEHSVTVGEGNRSPSAKPKPKMMARRRMS